MKRPAVRVTIASVCAFALTACGAGTVDGTGSVHLTSATVTVQSNLTGEPLAGAKVTVGSRTATTDASGSASIQGTGASLSATITGDGYDTGHATLTGGDTSTKVVLVAGPLASVRYIYDALIARNYPVLADETHSYEYQFVTRATVIASLEKADTDGYSLVSYTVKSVQMLPTWEFKGCSGKGARSFTDVAAVTLVSVTNTPQGPTETDTDTIHLVKDGTLWKFLPIVPGCNG